MVLLYFSQGVYTVLNDVNVDMNPENLGMRAPRFICYNLATKCKKRSILHSWRNAAARVL